MVGRRGVLLSVCQEGPPGRATLRVSLDGAAADSRAARAAARRVVGVALGGDTDVRAFYRAHRDDPLIGAAIRDFRGLRVAGAPSLWEAAVTAILAQQVNLMFAYDIRRELALAFGRRARFDGQSYVAFPAPDALAGESPAALSRFRLSRAKALAIHSLALAFSSGRLTEAGIAALEDEEAIERLAQERGVGRWTAEIALLRGLGRLDVFPAGDLGVVKYIAQGLLGRKARALEGEMRRLAERWSPHRSLGLVYAYAELSRRKSPPLLRSARRPAGVDRGSGRSRGR